MPDYRKMFDRDYIGHFDLAGDTDVKISRVIAGELTAMGGRKSKKPILYFTGRDKGMICNKTNAKTVAAMYGNETEKWVGKRITLYVSTTRNPDGGGETECIRVRPHAPADDQRAAGAGTPPNQAHSPVPDPASGGSPDALLVTAREFAETGTDGYAAWFRGLSAGERRTIGAERHEELKRVAASAPS